MKKFCRVAAAAAVALACVSAHAELYKFRLTGAVTSSGVFDDGTTVPVGTPVVGTFVYDTSAKPVYKDHIEAVYTFDDRYKFKLRFGAHSVRSVQLWPTINDNMQGNTQDGFDLSSSVGIYVDNAWNAEAYFGFVMYSKWDNTEALDSQKLPKRLRVQDFDAWRYGYVLRNGGQGGNLIRFSIDNIKSSPCLNGTDPKTACDD